MSQNRQIKEQTVAELREKLSLAKSVVLTDYRGLNVAESTELRRKLGEQNVEFRVVKNTMTRLACRELGLDGLDPYLEGPTALAISFDDPVPPAKGISDFAKEHEALQVKAALLGEEILDEEAVQHLAKLPSKQELLAQVLAAFSAPLSNMASLLNAPVRDLAQAVAALQRKREAEAS